LVGISIIFLSFPFSAVIVQGLGQVSYFGTLQVIAIFLVIGIAADDIFVFIDAWKQSEHIGQEIIQGDKKKRMAYAFRRGVRAMTVTSSTTAVAFFANAFSPIMPIRAFGIFTGVLIPINFFLVVMIMPPAVIYYESVVKKKYTRMCGCCPGKGKCCCCPAKQDAESTEVEEVAEGKENSKVEIFFDTTWNTNV
jgi:predicted RND superfamily exporter protein